MRQFLLYLKYCCAVLLISINCLASQPDRISGAVNANQRRAVKGNLHPFAQAQYDRGPVDPALQLDHVMLLIKPSAAQQADLDQLLAAQRNPSSASYRQWITPEAFADRFGLSTSDHSKVVAWLQAEGLTVQESARGRNWIAFKGSASQVGKSLQTSIHRYIVNGETHIANATEPTVPVALAEITAGFLGLDDFRLKPQVTKPVPVGDDPSYTHGTSNYLAPQDYATIYDLNPLYQAGFDGTGQSIAIVGASDILASDISSFRSKFGLPVNNPKLVPYGADPGFTGAQIEGNLDLEWAGAIAPKATIYYVYGADPLIATIYAIDLNAAPVISISYGNCEIEFPTLLFRSISQQGNAQGITTLAASGDSGAAGCDTQGLDPFATRGEAATFPSNLPEVTGVGGTSLNDAGGNYWSATNTSSLGSALSYIPEVTWNETAPGFGLGASGGGASILVTRPDWQTGPGVPADNARHIPDVAMSAAVHDAYMLIYQGALVGVGGTSAASPSLAGVISMLNQYQVSRGFQATPGLGNINPQLYRLAQSVPTAFHDITSGNNIVPCAQGTPNCLNQSYGYNAGPDYDMTTGLGSVDGYNLVTQWNTVARPVQVTLTASPSRVTLNDPVQLTATVAASDGTGPPTGTVNFLLGTTSLGTAVLSTAGTAGVTFQASLLEVGSGSVAAVYSGDATFSSGSATARVQIAKPVGVSAIEASISPSPVFAAPADAQGLSWQTIATLFEVGGVPSTLTSFTIDGQAQSLAQYFPSTSILANGTMTADLIFRNLPYPVTKTFAFTGVDATGATWTRTLPVTFLGPQVFQNFNLSAVPLTMTQNSSASASCPWSQQLTLDEIGGYALHITSLAAGNIDISDRIQSIFGTTRLAAYGSLQGTLCWSGITPPANNTISVSLNDEFGNTLQTQLTVSFAGAPSSPTKLSIAPASVTIPVLLPTGSINVSLADKAQAWTASVTPGNRTTGWLTLSQYSGTGPAQIQLTASGAGFEPGAYRALITLQSPNAVPQTVTVPVMFINGGAGQSLISWTANAVSFKPTVSPGQILAVGGTNLSNSIELSSTLPLPFVQDGVTATVNGIAAPLYYTSPGQLNVQVPYEAGAGPAVLGVNNNGQIAGYQLQIMPSAPAIVVDGSGNVFPSSAVPAGQTAVLYMTGDGDVTPLLATGATPAPAATLTSLPRPLLPVTVTVGGTQTFLQFVGIVPGVVGLTQVNFTVPSTVPAGMQPVVVTVGGVASPAANITVQ